MSNNLRPLIAALHEEVAASEASSIVRELLSRFFSEHDLPMPSLKFVTKLSAKYLARCVWFPGATNTEIEIQRSTLGDEKTLRRVLAHELIHHWQYLRTDQSTVVAMTKLGLKSDGHGPEFMKYAEKINAVMGADYVSKKSDQSYDTSKVPPFYVLVQPYSNDRLGYSVAVRPSAIQKKEIADRIQNKQARLFRITDGRFTNGPPIKRFAGVAIPRTDDAVKALRTIYDSGADITI